MLKLQEIKDILSGRKWKIAQIARELREPYHRVYFAISNDNPPYQIVEKLSDYIEKGGLEHNE